VHQIEQPKCGKRRYAFPASVCVCGECALWNAQAQGHAANFRCTCVGELAALAARWRQLICNEKLNEMEGKTPKLNGNVGANEWHFMQAGFPHHLTTP